MTSRVKFEEKFQRARYLPLHRNTCLRGAICLPFNEQIRGAIHEDCRKTC